MTLALGKGAGYNLQVFCKFFKQLLMFYQFDYCDFKKQNQLRFCLIPEKKFIDYLERAIVFRYAPTGF